MCVLPELPCRGGWDDWDDWGDWGDCPVAEFPLPTNLFTSARRDDRMGL